MTETLSPCRESGQERAREAVDERAALRDSLAKILAAGDTATPIRNLKLKRALGLTVGTKERSIRLA